MRERYIRRNYRAGKTSILIWSVDYPMRSFSRSVFVVAAVLSSAGAWAADLPSKAAPPILSATPVANWSGFYAGSFVGGSFNSFATRETAAASGTAFGGTTGALIGYNFQSGAIVFGVEGDIGSNYGRQRFSAKPGLVANQIDSIYAMHARARIGYDMGRFMPFLAAGFAYNRAEQYRQAPLEFDGQTRNLSGWTIGGGVDAKIELPILGPSILRAEYLYEGMQSATYDLNGPLVRTSMGTHYARLALISTVGENWRAPSVANPPDWSGSYVGAIVGDTGQRLTTKGLGVADGFSANGAMGGIYTGHNWMFGKTMLGIDSATMLANIDGHGAEPGAAAVRYRDFFESDFRGRVGYAIGRFLPFAAAGLAFGSSEQIDNLTGNAKGDLPTIGGTLGAGVDYMVTDRIAVRAEYLYAHSLVKESTHLENDTCCNQSRSSNSVRVGAAYFFH
jgi:opacity protein-like surface antigen